jgi:hypothetical protein
MIAFNLQPVRSVEIAATIAKRLLFIVSSQQLKMNMELRLSTSVSDTCLPSNHLQIKNYQQSLNKD